MFSPVPPSKRTKKRTPARNSTGRAVPVSKLMEGYSAIQDAPPKKRKPITCGRRSKLGISAFMATIFEINELNPRHKKLTNSAIEKLLIDEFPGRASIEKGLRSGKYGVNNYRLRYNTGVLTGTQPARISFRYNESGQPVEPRYGKKVLSLEEQRRIIDKFRNKFIGKAAKLLKNQGEENEDPSTQ